MSNFLSRNFLFLIVLTSFSFISLFASEYISKDFFGTIFNWSKMEITYSTKESLPRVIIDTKDPDYGSNETAYNISESRNKTLIIAKEKISLQIVRSLEQLRYNDNYTVLDMIKKDKFFRENFNEFVMQEKSRIRVKYHQDKVFVESTVSITGNNGLLNFLNIEYDNEKFPEFADTTIGSNYTGLIIDARHLDAKPALFPRLLTEKGLEIYSKNLVSKNHAISKGLVSYHTDPEVAMKNLRVGKKPYFAVALTTEGQSKTDLAITTKDAMIVLSGKHNKNMLRRCPIIILLSKENYN